MRSPDEEHGDSAHEPHHVARRHRRLSSARKPVDDAGADLPAGARRGASPASSSTPIFVDAERAPEFWRGTVAFNEHLAHAAHEVPTWVKLTPTIVMLIGLWIAWHTYIRDVRARRTASSRPSPAVHRFVSNKWYFDELYDFLFVRPALWLGRLFWQGGDEGTIDRFGPHGAAVAVAAGNRVTARLQSGYLYSYALVMLLGLIGAATWAIWWAR